MIQILIADDHLMFIKGLRLLLGTYEDLKIVAVANNGNEVLHQLKNVPIDVVLMDINMPGMNGYDATLEAMKLFPDVAIVALSMQAGASSVLRMLEAGAKGYLVKNTDEEELVSAIRTVAQGGYYVMQEYHTEYQQFLQWKRRGGEREASDHKVLTTREREILQLIIQGDTNIEIAEKLFLSNRTVDTHRKNILAKLELKNTAALVHFAMQNRAFLGLQDL